MIMKMKIDPRLRGIAKEANDILRQHKKILLKYNDSNDFKKEMYTIREIRVNNRSTSRRGCMKHVTSNIVDIEISDYMFVFPDKEILTTMLHEMLHCFRDSKGHEGNWKWRANVLSNLTGLNIRRTRSIEDEYTLRKEYKLNKKGRVRL